MSIPIAYQGITGAYSEQAALSYGKREGILFDVVACKDFRTLFDTINTNTSLGIVPIENSTAGSVVACYDLLMDYEFEIIGEFILPIKHCLLVNKGVQKEDVVKVYSHPQALSQCSKYVEKHNYSPISRKDTAGAAEHIKDNTMKDAGAIASIFCAQRYDLDVLEENIQNKNNNQTRFLIVKKKGTTFDFEKKLEKGNKTSVLFSVRSIPSALYKALGGFATNSVNLLKLESRPSQHIPFDHVFYLDFEGSVEEENVIGALEELKYFSDELKVLGSYPRHRII